ncbi:hypothetical protein P280DRAFT_543079 [Massarina eburnea CBS 473.64]|uniref:F-box domain-containing protein n=1 Tax=Massarina eburnea CBS 473.64 TaxID=1395130 RepID=A0A6A6RGN6_9PLEO|nr:hypothetical protein P280DRAFT_543079 [Massarina eburnea CBS 473.64]
MPSVTPNAKLPSPPMSIERLPEEILLQILPYLWCYDNHKDYSNLCLVKPFHSGATEYLYRNCHLHERDGKLVQFSRSIMKRPELGLLIRSLGPLMRPGAKGWWHGARSWLFGTRGTVLGRQDLDLFVRSVKSLGLANNIEALWVSALEDKKAYVNVLGALIILHSPNIKRLCDYDFGSWSPSINNIGLPAHLGSPQYWNAAFPQSRSQLVPRLPLFHQLKAAHIGAEDGMSIPHVAILLNVPSLEEVSFGAVKETVPPSAWSWEWKDAYFRTQSSNVKKVHFWSGCFHPEAMALVLRACKTLEVFICEGVEFSGKGISEGLTPIRSALDSFQHSLRVLRIWNTLMDEPRTCMPFGSFANFPRLALLHIDLMLIFGSKYGGQALSHRCPTSLKILQLADIGILSDSQLDKLFSNMKGNQSRVFPHLRRLKICTPVIKKAFADQDLVREMRVRKLGKVFDSRMQSVYKMQSIEDLEKQFMKYL